MKKVVTFILEKAARKGGGDKYTAEDIEGFSIYFPQTISRESGDIPIDKVRVIIKTGEDIKL
jgi:hypothetical protein